MFKQDWEKTGARHHLPANVIEQMLKLTYPNKNLVSYEIIAGGCANLNIKIQLENDEEPLLLRLYLRDRDAAFREQKLGELLKPTLPAPLTRFIGDCDEYSFAITEFLPGITLRDFLLNNNSHDIHAIMQEVGALLKKISSFNFPKTGFFDKDLNITQEVDAGFALDFAKNCLESSRVPPDLKPRINQCLDKYGHLFPDNKECHLVHADFDPSNILMDKVGEKWKVTGILDWEFAFSGPVLCDVATMLRYAHKIPPAFEEGFLDGLDMPLPEDWRIKTHLLNLLALLDLLVRYDQNNHPNQHKDILQLVKHILRELK